MKAPKWGQLSCEPLDKSCTFLSAQISEDASVQFSHKRQSLAESTTRGSGLPVWVTLAHLQNSQARYVPVSLPWFSGYFRLD